MIFLKRNCIKPLEITSAGKTKYLSRTLYKIKLLKLTFLGFLIVAKKLEVLVLMIMENLMLMN